MANLPTIPEYFRQYVNPSVDLNKTPKICCPFHQEDTPSFSYSKEKGIWRCFGACKSGGDVIDMHRLNYRFKTRNEAKLHLYKLLGIEEKEALKPIPHGEANEYLVRLKVAMASANRAAKTPEDWIELDYLMSQYPVDVEKIEIFANARK